MISTKFYIFVLLFALVSANNEWLQQALRIGRYLSRNTPIDKLNMPQTHNSYNTKAREYNFENQNLTLTEQLNAGYRFIDLDVHYISNLNPPYRVCHGSAEVQRACSSYQAYCAQFGFPDYGDSTGCQANALTLEETLSELKVWIESNPNELVVIHIETDSEVSMGDLSTFLGNAFGNHIFTKTDRSKFPNEFPSMEQIVNLKKSVFLSVQNSALVNDQWHKVSFWPSFPANKIKYFTGFPQCTSNYSTSIGSVTTFPGFYEDLSMVPSPFGGAIYDGKSDVGVMTPDLAQELAKCGFNAGFDFATESKLIDFIWHFAVGSPTQDVTSNCATMDNTLRWVDSNCEQIFPYACKNDIDGTWSISSITGKWVTGNVSCPTESTFSVPSSYKENFQLQQIKINSGVSNVWVKLTDQGHENVWTEDPNADDGYVGQTTFSDSKMEGDETSGAGSLSDSIMVTLFLLLFIL